MTLHKKEVLSVSFDHSSRYCATTAKDQLFILYAIDDYFKQAKQLLTQPIPSLAEPSLASIAVVETSKGVKHLVAAIADGLVVEIYHTVIANDTKPMVLVTRIEEAQADNIQQMQLIYDVSKEELFMITSARLHMRINIWKVPFSF